MCGCVYKDPCRDTLQGGKRAPALWCSSSAPHLFCAPGREKEKLWSCEFQFSCKRFWRNFPLDPEPGMLEREMLPLERWIQRLRWRLLNPELSFCPREHFMNFICSATGKEPAHFEGYFSMWKGMNNWTFWIFLVPVILWDGQPVLVTGTTMWNALKPVVQSRYGYPFFIPYIIHSTLHYGASHWN